VETKVKKIYKVLALFALFFLGDFVIFSHSAAPSSDEPEYARDPTIVFKAAGSYEQALQVWKSPEDINGWIAANFSYDRARALRLSETQRAKNERISIHAPSEFFRIKTGVCVDLSRFGVETLRRTDPDSDPKYLMIEFDPVQIKGDMLRLHWLVSFRRGGKIYIFADSKRPGHMAGPYNDIQAFIIEYERYRGRKIVAFRELDSYEKQRRPQAQKQERPRNPDTGLDSEPAIATGK
jgi:hypothetical protein